jgi:hypothetical protein
VNDRPNNACQSDGSSKAKAEAKRTADSYGGQLENLVCKNAD